MPDPVSPAPHPSDWPAILEALATTAAVLVALFQESFFRHRRRPLLKVEARTRPPDRNKTTISFPGGLCPAYFFRLWVENRGRSTATRVQVFASELTRKRADESFEPVDNFLPLNLKWTHAQRGEPGQVFSEGISAHMGQHCDLGVIFPPNVPLGLTGQPANVPAGKTHLQLETQVPLPNNGSCLAPGTYRLRLKVAAANADPVTVVLHISFSGDWYDDEGTMLAQGIGITVE